jgi:hypothetical protein
MNTSPDDTEIEFMTKLDKLKSDAIECRKEVLKSKDRMEDTPDIQLVLDLHNSSVKLIDLTYEYKKTLEELMYYKDRKSFKQSLN